MRDPDLGGVVPAVATPFDDSGAARPDRLTEIVRRLVATGLDGALVLGSTGEAIALDEAERAPLIAAARAGLGPQRPLVAGVDAHATAAAVRQSREAAAAGADAVLVLTPYYYRDALGPAALADHFRAVADASPVPILLYSVPKFTGVSIAPALAHELAGHPNVAGIKHSDGDVAALGRIVAGAPAPFVTLTGHAGTALDAFRAGAHGAILAAASAVPEPFVALWAGRAEAGARELAAAAGPLATEIVGRHGVAGVKAAMAYRGLETGPPRRPLAPVGAAARAGIERAIDAAVAAGHLPARAV